MAPAVSRQIHHCLVSGMVVSLDGAIARDYILAVDNIAIPVIVRSGVRADPDLT